MKRLFLLAWLALTTALAPAADQFSSGQVLTSSALNAAFASKADSQYRHGAAGSVARSVSSKLQDSVSVLDFGAKCDGATNDTAAFTAALLAVKSLRLPVGDCRIAGGLVISLDGMKLRGEGTTASKITVTTAGSAAISINGGLSNVEISGFTLTRSVTATSGGDGIRSAGVSIGQSTIRDMVVEKHYQGLNLGVTDWSSIVNVVVQKNVYDGIVLSNHASDGQLQWSLDGVLMQMNGNRGMLVSSVAGPSGVTLGTWRNIATFANNSFGIAVSGLAGTPINGVRIYGAFIGQDGNSELYLNTYGGQHLVADTFLELAGTGTTGPTLSTAASNVGSGLEVTANNVDVQITNSHANGNSLDGFYLNGTNHMLGNCRATNNGLALTSNRRNGVLSNQGRVVISGGAYGNTGVGTSQQYGAFVANGTNLAVTGADLTNNATAVTGATSNSTYITQVGNLPNNANVQLSPSGSVLVGGGATGGYTAVGTINVSGGLLKNNTAYSNP